MLLASLVLALAAQQPASSDGPIFVDQLVGIVNDQTLTLQEVQLEVRRFAEERGLPVETEGLARVVARNLLTDMLFAEGFRQAGLDEAVVQQIVNDELERRKIEFGSMAAFERHLASLGRNVAMERRALRQEIIATYFQQAEIGIAPELGGSSYRSFLTVSPTEVQEYYEAEQGQFSYPRLVNTRILMVPMRDDPEAARTIIEAARADSATDPLAFARACEESSAYGKTRQNLTGLVNPMEAGEVAAFREFLAVAAQGEISEAVEVRSFLVAVQAHQVQPAKQLTIGEAHLRIEAILLEQKRLKVLDEALNRQRKRCYVWTIPQLDGVLDNVYGVRPALQEEL